MRDDAALMQTSAGTNHTAPARCAAVDTKEEPSTVSDTSTLSSAVQGKKRTREGEVKLSPVPPSSTVPHSGPARRIDRVVYAGYEIQAQFSGSPYPLDELPGATHSYPEKGGPGAAARDGRVHARDVGGKFGRKPGKVGPNVASQGGPSSGATRPQEVEPATSLLPGGAVEAETASPALEIIDYTGSIGSTAPNGLPPAKPHGPAEHSDPLRVKAVTPTGDITSDLAPTVSAADGCPPVFAQSTPPSLYADLSIASITRSSSLSTLSPAASPDPAASLADSTSSAPAPPSGARAERGKRGRFLPKPPGESVKAKRAALRAAQPAAPIRDTPHLTQRQQREIARRAREDRARQLAHEAGDKSATAAAEEIRLLVCEKCFKYMALPAVFAAHTKECTVKQPPGRRVYQRGATSIWEVDGAVAKLYCQNLCLFAKLFIEHKYMFFDVEGFSFYLLTETMAKQEWVLGYFSKEKVSYDDNNLACIVVFPPFRQKGWATLLIEFSYELSRRLSTTPGSPERPLSDLGQMGYLAHWTAVLVRYFRAIFALRGEPPPIDAVLAEPPRPEMRSPGKGLAYDDDGEVDPAGRERRHKRGRRSKGWDGELPPGAATLAGSPAKAFTMRGGSIRPRPGVVDPRDGSFMFPTILEKLAHAVNLRADDVAFALVESGLARYRHRVGETEVKLEEAEGDAPVADPGVGGDATRELEILVTPELVEEVALRKGVKPVPMLDVAYVCNI